jgi:hypothetical protein
MITFTREKFQARLGLEPGNLALPTLQPAEPIITILKIMVLWTVANSEKPFINSENAQKSRHFHEIYTKNKGNTAAIPRTLKNR